MDIVSKHKLNSKIINELHWIGPVVKKLTRPQCEAILQNPDKYILRHRICNCCGVKKMLNLFVNCSNKYYRKCLGCNKAKVNKEFNTLEINAELDLINNTAQELSDDDLNILQETLSKTNPETDRRYKQLIIKFLLDINKLDQIIHSEKQQMKSSYSKYDQAFNSTPFPINQLERVYCAIVDDNLGREPGQQIFDHYYHEALKNLIKERDIEQDIF